MKRLIMKVLLVTMFAMLTPFGIFLSFFPGFHGPREWFEFCFDRIKA
jgi:hypothetical protein